MDMDGSHVVIVGGGGGLGRGTAKLMAKYGAAGVAVIDVAQALVDPVVADLNDMGCQAAGIAGDAAFSEGAHTLFDQAVERFGRIHAMVNCAGVYPRRPILEISDEDWDFDWKVNVRGTYNMMAAAVELMRTQPLAGQVRGRIVNIASVDAFKAHPQNAHYAATKAAVVSLTRSFALEFAPDQILVNAIAPGGIATEKAKGSGFLAELAAHTPLARNAQPDEIASWIAFMLGDANSYMTGETVIVSGGYIFA